MSKSAWICAGKVSAATAAVALLLGAVFQGQAQQRSDMADVRAELRSGFAEVNGRFGATGHGGDQGCTILMSMPSKSRTLRVATVMPRERAIAAIWQSAGAMGRPAERRAAAISA